MRIPSFHQHDEARDDPSMTPMIDVVFLLLIFFVCASVGQVREALLPTELSAGVVESEERIKRDKPFGEVWIRLRRTADAQTVFEIDGRAPIEDFDTLRQLLTELAAAAAEIPVILDVGTEVPMSDVIAVYDTCRVARFQSIHFAVNANAASATDKKRRP